ncbi:hypothetical protein HDV63DRAFT_284821 [Trichoderma sp. SZMC 28014]
MGHNQSPQDSAHLSEAVNKDKDNLYLADADSKGSAAKRDDDAPPAENNDPLTFSVDSVDGKKYWDGDGFYLSGEAGGSLYRDNGFLLSGVEYLDRSAEEHNPPDRSSVNPQESVPDDGSNNLSNVLSNALSIDPAIADDLSNVLSVDLHKSLPKVSCNCKCSKTKGKLSKRLKDSSHAHPSKNKPSKDNHKAPPLASDSRFDENGMERIRWFKPSQIQGIPPDRLIVYNTRKQICHMRKLKPHNFPFLHTDDTWVDERTCVISIAGLDKAESHMPAVFGAYYGPKSRFNLWRPVTSELPHNKNSACINAMQYVLGFAHNEIFLMDPEINTVIIKNSSPWLTRAMTGGLELYNYCHYLPWMEGQQMLYLPELLCLVRLMKVMANHKTHPVKVMFWCVEPEANREAIELAQRVYAGSRK